MSSVLGNMVFKASSSFKEIDFKMNAIAFMTLFLITGTPLFVYILISAARQGINSHYVLELDIRINSRDSKIFSSLINW